MRFYLLTIALLSSGFYSFAQRCTCQDKFRFVKTSIEKNYSGVQDKINPATKKRYDALSQQAMQQAAKAVTPLDCHLVIYDWLQFFRDGHIQFFTDAYRDVDDSIATLLRIKETETLHLTDARLASLQASEIPEEGIYMRDDSLYTVAIIKDKKKDRDFSGVIVSSRHPLWKKGQLKLKLLRQDSTSYRAVVYRDDHRFNVHQYHFDRFSFNYGDWVKLNDTKPREQFSVEDIAARTIGDSTIYVQIGTFHRTNTRAIDSVFEALAPLLKKLPNLIIDIRGNGGGDDDAYHSITPWLYTGPVISTGSDVWSSRSNTDAWQKLLEDPDIPGDTKKDITVIVRKMQAQPDAFVRYGDDDTFVLNTVELYPKRVVVLTDGRTGSSAEQFVLAASQSKKVTIMGQATEGKLDYANVRQSAEAPCRDILLFYATSRKRYLNKGKKIDAGGIAPDILLPPGSNWIGEAINYLAK